MVAAEQEKLMTAEDLLRLPKGMGSRYELVRGELKIMSPAGFEHGDVGAELLARLRTFVRAKRLGTVPLAETGYRLWENPDTVRAPDISFVSAARVKKAGKVKGYFPGAPDLAVEVVSPDDTAEEVKTKVGEYFQAGAQMVWVIYPRTQEVVVFRSARESLALSAPDTLDGGDLIPGFACPVAELFE